MIPDTIFKAYDIRGHYPDEINESAVAEIASVLSERWKAGRVVVGHDARLSSPSLYRSILNALATSRQSLVAVPIGLCTTPMFYFWCHKLKLPGIMITASHNPKDFNGLKVVGSGGAIISGSEINKWII